MKEPQRILVVETLYLGDLIHTLPLIQALRRRHLHARLDVLVRAPHVSLMQCVQGIDMVFTYQPKQHRGLRGIWMLCKQLRAQRYDLVINPGGSDRAGWITAASGGVRRVGRCNRRGHGLLARLLHDEVVQCPWGADVMYWQKHSAFAALLQLPSSICFGLRPPALDHSLLGLPKQYIHISPFASEDVRCLPPATVITLLTLLHARYPELGLVLSAGPSARERNRLELIGQHLESAMVRILPATVDLTQLAGVIEGAILHIGPDSGPLHLAYALDTPAVGCFLFKDASAEWMPMGSSYRTVGTTTRLEGGLYALSPERILDAAAGLLDRPGQ